MSWVWRGEGPTNSPRPCLASNFAGSRRGRGAPDGGGGRGTVPSHWWRLCCQHGALPGQPPTSVKSRSTAMGISSRHAQGASLPTGCCHGADSQPAPRTPPSTRCPTAPPAVSRVAFAIRSQAPSASPPAQGRPGRPSSLDAGTSIGSAAPRRAAPAAVPQPGGFPAAWRLPGRRGTAAAAPSPAAGPGGAERPASLPRRRGLRGHLPPRDDTPAVRPSHRRCLPAPRPGCGHWRPRDVPPRPLSLCPFTFGGPRPPLRGAAAVPATAPSASHGCGGAAPPGEEITGTELPERPAPGVGGGPADGIRFPRP